MVEEYFADYGYDHTIFTESMMLFLEDGDNSSKNTDNDGVLASIGKAINGIITGFISFIKNLFGGGNKATIEKCGEKLKEDPSLGDKKVQYEDCGPANKERARFLNELLGCKSDEEVETAKKKHKGLLNKILKGAGTAGAVAVTTITVKQLYNSMVNTNAFKDNEKARAEDAADAETMEAINAAKRICEMNTADVRKAADDQVKKATNGTYARQAAVKAAEETVRDAINASERSAKSKIAAIKGVVGDGGKEIIQQRGAYAHMADEENKESKLNVKRMGDSYKHQADALERSINAKKKRRQKLLSQPNGDTKHYKEIRTLEEQIAQETNQLRELGSTTSAKIDNEQNIRASRMKEHQDNIKNDKVYFDPKHKAKRAAEDFGKKKPDTAERLPDGYYGDGY